MSEPKTTQKKRGLFRKLLSRSKQEAGPRRRVALSGHGPPESVNAAEVSAATPPKIVPAGPVSKSSASPAPPNSSLPPESRDLWNDALRTLSPEERSFISEHRPIAHSSVTENFEIILKEVEGKKKICEQKRWTLKWGESSISLHAMANKLCNVLDRFKQIGDIAVNVDPVHAGLPWAFIRLIVQIGVSGSQQMEALLCGLHQVVSLINRCKIYETLFLDKTQHGQALENLELTLIELYAAILQFLAKANGLYTTSTVSRTTHAFLYPDDVAEFQKKCGTLAENVETAAGHCKWIDDSDFHAANTARADKLNNLLVELKEDFLIGMDSRIATLWDRSNQDERKRILDWASDILVQDHHVLACERRTPATGEWLFQTEQYQNWRSSDESMILWLHGIPGAGKTKLISKVIDDLSKAAEDEMSDDEPIAYFYCNRNEESRQNPLNVLRSLVKQLSVSPNIGVIHTLLVDFYKKKDREDFSSGTLTSEESESLLVRLTQSYSRTTLVIDALDECDARLGLIQALDRLVSASANVKILISSRRDEDIKLQLEKKANFGVSATDNKDDISKFVKEAIEADTLTRRIPIPRDLQGLIVQTLLEKSEGMFQWAALQIKQLLALKLPQDMKKRLGKLPKDLEAAYNEIYTTILNQEGSEPKIAARAFQWVMASIVPLSPEQLVAAAFQDPEKAEPEEVNGFDVNFILGVCQNLLVVDDIQNVCRFAHLSIQEYLETHYWDSDHANTLIAKVCLRMLNFPDHWTHDLSRNWIRANSINSLEPYWKDIDHATIHTIVSHG